MIRKKSEPQDMPAAASCDRHLAKHMRDVTAENGDTADTQVLVRRLDEPDDAYLCSCGATATWYLITQAVVR